MVIIGIEMRQLVDIGINAHVQPAFGQRGNGTEQCGVLGARFQAARYGEDILHVQRL